jgi:hypothetical protein
VLKATGIPRIIADCTVSGEISVLRRGYVERLEMDSAMTFPESPAAQ